MSIAADQREKALYICQICQHHTGVRCKCLAKRINIFIHIFRVYSKEEKHAKEI
jgi:hypothetical protein